MRRKDALSVIFRELRDAQDADAYAGLLARAEALAPDGPEWRSLFMAALADPVLPAVAAFADRALPGALACGDRFAMRDVAAVAELRAGPLADRAAAVEALRLGEERLADGSDTAAWIALAFGYRQALDDEVGVRRCMDHAEATATRARRLVDAAAATAQLWPGSAHAVALAERAASIADLGDSLFVARFYAKHGHPTRAVTLLERAIVEAPDSAVAFKVATACARLEQSDLQDRALARAWAFVDGAEDRLAFAETCFSDHLGDDWIRRALEQALHEDPALRPRVAEGFMGWLHDEVSGMALGGGGVPPDECRRFYRAVPGFEGSASGLVDWLSDQVTDAQLRSIAGADWGFDADRHERALRFLVTERRFPPELPLYPREVVSLTRWSRGEDGDHLPRVLCATWLALAPGDAELYDVLQTLVHGCIAMGREACEHGQAFVAWLCETADANRASAPLEHGEFQPESAPWVALMLLTAWLDPADERLAMLRAELARQEFEPADLRRSIQADVWWELLGGDPGA